MLYTDIATIQIARYWLETADEKMTNTIVYKYKLSSGFLARRNKPSSNKVPKNNRNIGIFSIITSGATPFQKGALAKPR